MGATSVAVLEGRFSFPPCRGQRHGGQSSIADYNTITAFEVEGIGTSDWRVGNDLLF